MVSVDLLARSFFAFAIGALLHGAADVADDNGLHNKQRSETHMSFDAGKQARLLMKFRIGMSANSVNEIE